MSGLLESQLFAAELLGDASIVTESACGAPLSLHVQRLGQLLAENDIADVRPVETDLYSLVGDDLQAALDGVAEGLPGPFVVFEGRLVCSGRIDAGSVIEALSVTGASTFGRRNGNVPSTG